MDLISKHCERQRNLINRIQEDPILQSEIEEAYDDLVDLVAGKESTRDRFISLRKLFTIQKVSAVHHMYKKGFLILSKTLLLQVRILLILIFKLDLIKELII